ncbi:hypothetical protein CRYUN_Cryun18bG0120100 [Craigia yunnanensis]
MDDGELDFSNQEVFSGNNMGDIPSSCSMDSFFDELLNDSHACTHTHTCNPPGPDNSHTHTCFHFHTKIVPAPTEDKDASDDTAGSREKKSKKRPLGNREAVRKYREKVKARAASLEDEVVRLRTLNQQLLKRLQGQAALEAENARLKCLLVDIRGRIEGEIGSFPYQKSTTNVNMMNLPDAYVMNPCNVQCNDQMYCLHPGVEGRTGEAAAQNGQGFNGCEFDDIQCLANQNSGAKELFTGGVGSAGSNGNSSGTKRRKACDSHGKLLISLHSFQLFLFQFCVVSTKHRKFAFAMSILFSKTGDAYSRGKCHLLTEEPYALFGDGKERHQGMRPMGNFMNVSFLNYHALGKLACAKETYRTSAVSEVERQLGLVLEDEAH